MFVGTRYKHVKIQNIGSKPYIPKALLCDNKRRTKRDPNAETRSEKCRDSVASKTMLRLHHSHSSYCHHRIIVKPSPPTLPSSSVRSQIRDPLPHPSLHVSAPLPSCSSICLMHPDRPPHFRLPSLEVSGFAFA